MTFADVVGVHGRQHECKRPVGCGSGAAQQCVLCDEGGQTRFCNAAKLAADEVVHLIRNNNADDGCKVAQEELNLASAGPRCGKQRERSQLFNEVKCSGDHCRAPRKFEEACEEEQARLGTPKIADPRAGERDRLMGGWCHVEQFRRVARASSCKNGESNRILERALWRGGKPRM